MTEKFVIYDNAGIEYETTECLLTRWDGLRVFRVDAGAYARKKSVNVVMIPGQDGARLRNADLQKLRSNFSAVSMAEHGVVLYPQMMAADDNDELHGYLGWLPENLTRLIPLREYASDHHRMLTAGYAMAELFASLGDDRILLSMADPDGFFIDPDQGVVCYVSTDLSEASLKQREDYCHYVPPELLVYHYSASGANATTAAADYVLAVLLYRLFMNDGPFSGEDVIAQICDGVSVFYDDSTEAYEKCMRCMEPELIRLFRLAFDYSSRSRYETGRPTAEEWKRGFAQILAKDQGGNGYG